MESNVAFKLFHDDLRSWLLWVLRTKHEKLVFSIADMKTGNISLQRHHTFPQKGLWSCFTKLLFKTGCTGFFRIPRQADTNVGRRHLPELGVLSRLYYWIACPPAEPPVTTSQETTLSQSQQQLILPNVSTRHLGLDEVGFYDAITLHR